MKTIPSLNGIRAFSIVIVILSHLVENDKIISLHSNFRLLQNGQFGVNIFFILSGFLITKILVNEYWENGNISLMNFFMRRTLRIFPAYYFLLVIYFVLQLQGLISLNKIEWFSSITYTRQFFKVGWLCGHFWSLSVEEFFYLIYPFTFIIFYKSKERYNIILIASVLLLFPLFRYLGSIYMPNTSGYNLFYRGDALVIGCLIGLNYDTIKVRMPNNVIYPLCALLILFIYQHANYFFLNTKLINVLIGRPGESLLDNILISFLIVYCIENKSNIVYKILNSRVLNFIGVLSYSLYLWQQLFMSEENIVNGWLKNLLVFPTNLFMTVIMALISYYVIEKPLFKLKDKFKSNRPNSLNADLDMRKINIESQ